MSFGFALLIGFSMVLVIEGIVLALFPARVEDALRLISQIPVGMRRTIGLCVVALGVVMVALLLSAV